MRFTLDELVQRELHYAIVDEVDSILIDEARTPLIISGPAEESTDLYYKIDRIIPKLKRAATIVGGQALGDRGRRRRATSSSTRRRKHGVAHRGGHRHAASGCSSIDNLYDPQHIDALHHVQQALRAHALFRTRRRLRGEGRRGRSSSTSSPAA